MSGFLNKFCFAVIVLIMASTTSIAEVVVRDGDIEITREEFEAALTMMPGSMLNAASNDLGERYELINNMMQVRKLAARADKLSSDTPGYWEAQFQILAIKRELAYQMELGKKTVPRPQQLAREYYETQKDKYAKKPETRLSSHILLASAPGLPREEVRAKAQDILDELRAGADFEALVQEYSADPGSKSRGGAIPTWMRFGDPGFSPPYSEALFTIEKVGDYAEITDSQFGIHIIRLDGVREGGYYPFEDVKQKIFADIVAEYRRLATSEINSRYDLTDEAYIDGPAMQELFEQRKKQ
ncbi:peptidylprolyl isomerase [Congregibacter brevis]|uniref:peptidylprolyl isomerase n=1 Tax=Congregibacter brevis TaxID=3081201 RepID=A0ABZ0IBM8_9GAMM|nr:peptidylprolyl isomerase [Congregibacter sp. IMCC45268]